MVHQHHPSIKSHDAFSEYRHIQRGRLVLTISITLIVMVIEVIGGLMTNSMALISDAGHMFTHLFALLIGFGAILCSSIDACHHRTYGFYRAEVLAALFNSIFLFAMTGLICWESIRRLFEHREILTAPMFWIAALGLVVNLISIGILHGSHHHDRNIKGIVLHMFADTGSSVAIVIGAVIINYTQWYIIDPILSIGIAFLICYWAWGLFKDSINVLLETAPRGIMTDNVAQTIEQDIEDVVRVEDIHIWEITSNMFSMTAHVLVKDMLLKDASGIRDKINDLVYKKYNIGHTTIQFRGS